MLIDCETCPVRGSGCSDCLVSALFDPPGEVELLDRDELWAVETLARAGFDVTLLDPRPRRRSLRLTGRRASAA